MDKIRAKNLASELKGKEVSGWVVGDYIGNGASGVVVKATKSAQEAALKIIDPELEQKFGEEHQRQRVLLENSIKDQRHPNLVKIFEGGRCSNTDYLFVAMEFLPLATLTSKISQFPINKVRNVISQVAAAAKFLEDLGYSHRDIKPDNIVVSDECDQAILLDLGIVRPVQVDNGTGGEFIGTTAYSPPEFLFRTEKDTLEAWRAITFYQLGAILYDMLMKKGIFQDFKSPYANLVEAVKSEIPIIDAPEAPADLVNLAKSCLNKVPDTRLALVSWDDFLEEPLAAQDLSKLKEMLRQRQLVHKQALPAQNVSLPAVKLSTFMREACLQISMLAKEICEAAQTFPPLNITIEKTSQEHTQIVQILTGPSAPHELANMLYIQFKITAVDLLSSSLIVRGRSSIITSPADDEWKDIFKGTDSNEMKASMDAFMHQSLLLGQIAGPSHKGKILKFIGEK